MDELDDSIVDVLNRYKNRDYERDDSGLTEQGRLIMAFDRQTITQWFTYHYQTPQYPRRAVGREEYRFVHKFSDHNGMSCNYFQQDAPDQIWHLHMADGTLVPDESWTRTTEQVQEFLYKQIWIELTPEDKPISYMGKQAYEVNDA